MHPEIARMLIESRRYELLAAARERGRSRECAPSRNERGLFGRGSRRAIRRVLSMWSATWSRETSAIDAARPRVHGMNAQRPADPIANTLTAHDAACSPASLPRGNSLAGPVAVLGLGAVGSRIAARLHYGGYETLVWNRDADAARHLVLMGATAACSPAEAVAHADTVIVTVSDPRALVSVTEGPYGIAAGTRPGTQIIVMSTVGPAAIAQFVRAMPEDTEILDAPCLGSLAEAEQGRLQIFVSGTETAALRADPLLRTLGTPLYLGHLGLGSAAKLVANYALLGALAVLGEAVALADRLDVPREKTFDILAETPLSAQAQRRRTVLESGQFPPRFRLALARKDIDLMLAALGSPGDELMPLLHSVRSWLLKAESEGRGDQDYTAMLATIVSSGGLRFAD